MTWPLIILARLKSAASWLLGAITAYPWQAACIALALLSAWLWNGKADLSDDLATEQASHQADIAEWNRKSALAKAATAKAEADAKEASNDAQETYEKLAAADDSLDRYIADHRVRSEKQCPGSTTSASQGDAAAVPAEPASGPLVAISEPDIRACDGAYVYAMSAYQWGQELTAKGLASEK